MPATVFRVAIFPDTERSWCARALEADVVVVAATADVALDALTKVLHTQMDHDRRQQRPVFSTFAAAPGPMWDAFAAAAAARHPIEITRNEAGNHLRMLVATLPANQQRG